MEGIVMDTDKIINFAKAHLQNTQKKQDRLYEHHVIKKILNGENADEVAKGYNQFIDSINGFHATGFEQTVSSILKEDEKTLDKFTSMFQSIPNYVKARDTWIERTAKIAKSDDTPEDRQMRIHSIDILRTRQHDNVIKLFNSLNEYAEENNLLIPYPTNYHLYHKPRTQDEIQEFHRFDITDTNQRSDVSNILTEHITVLESVGSIIHEKFKDSGQTQTTEEWHKTLSTFELYEEAKRIKAQAEEDKQLINSVEELSSLNQEELAQ